MYPGYRKKTKFIVNSREKESITTRNEVVDLINKYSSSEEFYEIEPAEVLKVWINPEETGFPTKIVETPNGEKEAVPDLNAIGSIIVSLRESQRSSEDLKTLVYPISPHIVQYPLRGEVVNVASYEGKLFYTNPLNLNGKVNVNRLSGKGGEGLVTIENTKYNRKIYPQHGDLIIQGRFGQSIRMGSDKNYEKPNLKISVGQGSNKKLKAFKALNKDRPHTLNVNNDEASIWITTNEPIPLRTPESISADKNEDPRGGEGNSLITINADSLIFNSRESRIHMFSKENINLSAVNEINLETPSGQINLLDPNSTNPVVKGEELKEFFIDMIMKFEKSISGLTSLIEPRMYSDDQKSILEQYKANVRADMSNLKSNLEDPEFFSDRVFIGINKNKSSVDLKRVWPSINWSKKQLV